MRRLTQLRQSRVRSFRIKFNVSRATDLSGMMDTLIFLMSSDAVGEINFASFHPGFHFNLGSEIHWKNKRHDKREMKKKTEEREKKGHGSNIKRRDDDRTNHESCQLEINQRSFLLVSHLILDI